MLTGRGRYVACAFAAVLAIGGTGAALALSQPSGRTPAQTTVALCGLVACANVPAQSAPTRAPAAGAPSTALGPGGSQTTRPPSPSLTPSAPAATHRPRPAHRRVPPPSPPSPPASPSPTGPDVTVTFTPTQLWRGGFQGQLTLDNQGGSPVTGWQVVLALPGDQVRFVWNAEWQFGDGSLTLTPASGDQVIEPGASVTVNLMALGGTTQPANCTFDGSACR
jgi:alpha-galactosidase